MGAAVTSDLMGDLGEVGRVRRQAFAAPLLTLGEEGRL